MSSPGYEHIYGRQAVREVLRADRRRAHRLLLAQGIQVKGEVEEILSLAERQAIPVQPVPRRELDRIHPGHQGVALEATPYPYVDLDAILRRPAQRGEVPLLLLLDCLQDPQNFGSLLRTAEATGVHGVIIPRRHAVGVTPTVVNTSSGAVEYLLVARVVNLARTMTRLREVGIWLAGLENLPQAQPYTQADLTVPLGLIVGSEGKGLRRLVRERCDFLLRLPMRGRINSLNAAVAGSVVLYEVLRQREG